jgi:hypothetical protein
MSKASRALKPIEEASAPSAVGGRPRRRAALRALDVIDTDLARRQKLTESERAEEDEDSEDYGFSESLENEVSDDSTSDDDESDIDDDEDDQDGSAEELIDLVEEEEKPAKKRKLQKRVPDVDEEDE